MGAVIEKLIEMKCILIHHCLLYTNASEPCALLPAEQDGKEICEAKVWPVRLDKVHLAAVSRLPHHKVGQAFRVAGPDEDVKLAGGVG